MKTVFYYNNEDGSFTKMFTDDFDAYNRPYKSDQVSHADKFGVLYDIEVKDDIMTCYVCDVNSSLANELEIINVEILDNPFIKNMYTCHDKYLEGKKCKTYIDGSFTMGKILGKYSVKEFYSENLKFRISRGAELTCVI
jgi:hypothetical protein